jgi:adenylosuccinate synthase
VPRLVVVLSGPIASGKSELTRDLSERRGAVVFSTRELLRELGAGRPRREQRTLGDDLDKVGGRWIADALAAKLQVTGASADAMVVVDSVRREAQVDALRRAFGVRVVHLHLTAREDILEQRYRDRAGVRGDTETYADARAHPTEARIEELARIADFVIDTSRCDEADVRTVASHRLGFFPNPEHRLVDVLIGGEYGSEGKGNVASYLAQEYALLVRGGGPNAGHKVVLPTRSGHPNRLEDEAVPEVYTHHHLPSGTRTSNARVLIVAGAVLELDLFLKEVHDCGLDIERLAIDPHALLIEPEDREAEAELARVMGSTQKGVGAAAARRIMGRDGRPMRFAKDVIELRPYVRWAADELDNAYARGEPVMLEGTQGTGLSIWHGAYPWVTSRDTTVSGCLAEAGIPPARVRRVVMTCRANPIRVQSPTDGWSGPMRWREPAEAAAAAGALSKGEIDWREVSVRSGKSYDELTQTERTSTTNRQRRVGEFDWVWLHRAAQLNRPTDIALTFADYLGSANARARRFDQLTAETARFIEQVEAVAHAPASLISTGFSRNRIIDRRQW